MKVFSSPLLIAALGLIVTGSLTAKSPTNKSLQTTKAAKQATKRKTPRPTQSSRAQRNTRPQRLASRGTLDQGGRDMAGVLLTSPKAIHVEKAARRLTLYQDGVVLKTYLTTIGRNEFAVKTRAGDWATPEGLYQVRRKVPNSKYYLALHINYPNQSDAERGLASGLISPSQYNSIVNALAKGQMPPQNTRLGYYIEIHGSSNRVIQSTDGQPMLAGWTRGCVGMRDVDIEEIYAWAPNGTPVLITP